MSEAAGVADFDPYAHLPCGVLTLDSKGLILQANSSFCEWTGYSSGELVGQLRFQDFLAMGGRILYQTHLAPLLVMQGSIAEVKLDLHHRDTTVVPIVFNATRFQHDGSWLLRVAVFVARDRDRYEKELLLSRQKLEIAVEEATSLKKQSEDRALFAEQMIGIVGHDLRNPLSTIRLGLHLLEKQGAAPDKNATLRKIQRAADRATELVRDLLDFTSARIGGGLTVHLVPADLHTTVALAVEEISLAFPSHSIIHIREGDGTSLIDPNRVTQAIGNLVSNAVSYGACDQPITVTSTISGATWRVAVHNWGIPIASDVQTRIFTPMVRGVAEDSANRNVGLGLFIVSELAKAHGGSVKLSSDEERGTIFEIFSSDATGLD
ncbi:PAS domain-containing sensor histidine kinase [Acidovorax sp. LjRoot117]|uniref:PAS domain-containing sensor histidine kinase n=1 Tax=Acidovorax sp. LjRoot117 TaxID=3342255 RepID=UPI003ECD065F